MFILSSLRQAHKAGGYVACDATFGPPPLQNPFDQNADMVMHSATKYFGGHSDLLAGVLAVKTKEECYQVSLRHLSVSSALFISILKSPSFSSFSTSFGTIVPT